MSEHAENKVRKPDAHVIQRLTTVGDEDDHRRAFLFEFLRSPVFHTDNLQNICRRLRLRVTGDKQSLSAEIAKFAMTRKDTIMIVLEELVVPNKRWVCARKIGSHVIFSGKSPAELLFEKGSQNWYGPIPTPVSGFEGTWYVRPVFIPYDSGVRLNNERLTESIRWLVFACVQNGIVSLHWNNFTLPRSNDFDSDNETHGFRHWLYVPNLLTEICQQLQATTKHFALHRLILFDLLDHYRGNPEFKWTHKGVRADADGVYLHAKAGKGKEGEMDEQGIKKLARVIHNAVAPELTRQYGKPIPNPSQFEEYLTDVIVRQAGTLSYEFLLQDSNGEQVFRGHSYFGMRDGSKSPDRFAHTLLWVDDRPYFEQCKFLFDAMAS